MEFHDLSCIDSRPADAEYTISFALDCNQCLVGPISWSQFQMKFFHEPTRRNGHEVRLAYNALANEPGFIWPHNKDDHRSDFIRVQ